MTALALMYIFYIIPTVLSSLLALVVDGFGIFDEETLVYSPFIPLVNILMLVYAITVACYSVYTKLQIILRFIIKPVVNWINKYKIEVI